MSKLISEIQQMETAELFEIQQEVETQMVKRGIIPGPGLTKKRAYKKIKWLNGNDTKLFADLASKIVLNTEEFELLAALYYKSETKYSINGMLISTGRPIKIDEHRTLDDYIKDIHHKMKYGN
jgi:hypothetical protein